MNDPIDEYLHLTRFRHGDDSPEANSIRQNFYTYAKQIVYRSSKDLIAHPPEPFKILNRALLDGYYVIDGKAHKLED